jgi:geranylgeranyl reductase family protein
MSGSAAWNTAAALSPSARIGIRKLVRMSSSHVEGTTYDVVVVGAGPAGSSAALAAARSGATTLLADRAEFPRYKTCGGGLIGATLDSLPPGLTVPVRQEIFAATFSLMGNKVKTKRANERVLSMVNRADFDHALVKRAQDEGAVIRFGTTILSVSEESDIVRVRTDQGELTARYVIGADGSASRIGRYVGVTLGAVDLGLEVEVEAGAARENWNGRIHLDWGPLPGSYGWVFPKGDILTVGVIAQRGNAEETTAYLEEFLRQQGLQDHKVTKSSGHLTRWRTPDSPLGKGRVLVCGDAAGLLEPWTREGISFAVRSGTMAGRSVSAGPAPMKADDALAHYVAQLKATLLPEMDAGRTLLQAFKRHPAIMHFLLMTGPTGWRMFQRFTRGETSLDHVLKDKRARFVVGYLAGKP